MTTTLEKDWRTWSVEKALELLSSTDKEVRFLAKQRVLAELKVTTDRNFLERFLNSDDEEFVHYSVENPLVTADELKEFAKKSEFVRWGCAGNPNLNEEVCEVILEHLTAEDECLSQILTAMEQNMGGLLPEKLFFKWLIKLGHEGFGTTEHYWKTSSVS